METMQSDSSWLVHPVRILQTPAGGEEIISLDQAIGEKAKDFDIWDSVLDKFNGTSTGNLRPATDVEVSAVVTAFGMNTIIFVAALSCYEIMFRIFPSVYRCNLVNIEAGINVPKSSVVLGWVPAIMRVSWTQVRKLCGMDAYMFLRYIRMCFQITAVSGLWGIAILWPVFATGGNDAHGWYYFSMANTTTGSWRLWCPTVFAWLLTFYVVYIMNEEYKHYIDCRMEFLAKGDNRVHALQRYSLLIEEVPTTLQSDEALGDYFQQLFPGKVLCASMVLSVPDLDELVARRDKVVRRLEKCLVIKEIAGKRPTHKVGTHKLLGVAGRAAKMPGRQPVNLYEDDIRLPQPGERVDSIMYYTTYLAILNEKVAEVQAKKLRLAAKGQFERRASEWISNALGARSASRRDYMESDEGGLMMASGMMSAKNAMMLAQKIGLDFLFGGISGLQRPIGIVVDNMLRSTLSTTGFVTFTDLVTLTSAVRAPLSDEAGVLSATMAPDPRDVVWSNAHINQSWGAGREWTANLLLGLGAILWSIPVAGVQALANIDSLAQIPGMSWIEWVIPPHYAAICNGYLPVLALIALISVLPIVFHWVAVNYEHRKKQSDIQNSILKRSFYYLLANVFVTITAGSILDSLAEILDHPSNAFALLGESVPTVVGYFVMFVLTKLLAGLPIILLRLGTLLRRIVSSFMCQLSFMTQREIDEEYKPEPFDLGREYPNQLLLIVIMFTYATISPVILPVGALYFFAAYLVYKNQLLFVYSPTYESGGIMFPSACHRTLVGLMCGQLTLIGYTVLRRGFYQPIVLLPLPFYTISMVNVFKRKYEDPGSHLSLERAIQLDKNPNMDKSFLSDKDVYRQPVLKEEEVEPIPFHHRRDTGDDVNPAGGRDSPPDETPGKAV